MNNQIKGNRRRFLSAAAMTIAAAPFGAIDVESAHASQTQAPTPAAPATSFGALKQIDAGVLNIGYAEAGPTGGSPVILLHGWPYDIHTYVDVAPLLASAGYRVIVPYLRGYGTTRFLSSDTLRNGQQAALAADVVALMDALAIDKAIVAGCDWGARTANIVAAAVAGALQGHGIRERLSDRQPRGEQDAATAGGRAPVVVPVLLRDGPRPCGIREIPRATLPG